MNRNPKIKKASLLLSAALPFGLIWGALHANAESLTVYKSLTCGCCADWIDHVENADYETEVVHPTNLSGEKDRLGVAQPYRSCHTAVSDSGYLFEGHVPAKYMDQFLADPPKGAIGLAVPGMPVGSPGMEMGERFDPYQVITLMEDGSWQPYAQIDEPADQY